MNHHAFFSVFHTLPPECLPILLRRFAVGFFKTADEIADIVESRVEGDGEDLPVGGAWKPRSFGQTIIQNVVRRGFPHIPAGCA